MKQYLFLIILMHFYTISDCQNNNIKGIIRNSALATPVANANIILSNNESDQFITGTISNKNGAFRISKPNNNCVTLTVSRLGYVSKKVLINSNTYSNPFYIELTPDTITIEEVTVVWKPLIDYNEEGDVALNVDQMGNVEKLFLSDIITNIPGLSIDIDGNVLYGGYHVFTTLINGERMGSYYRGKPGFILAGIEAKNIKRIEVITEPNGRFGFYTPVINIIPKGDLQDIYYASADVGTKDKYALNLDFTKKFKKLTFRPSITYENTQYTTKEEEERSDIEATTTQAINNLKTNKQIAPSMEVDYAFNRDQRLSLDMDYTSTNFSNNRNLTYLDGINICDLLSNKSSAYNLSAAYYKRLNIGFGQYGIINAKASVTENKDNETQDQWILDKQDKYQTESSNKNYDASLFFNYNYHKKGLFVSANANVSYSYYTRKYNREIFDITDNLWHEQYLYENNTTTRIFTASLSPYASYLIRTPKKTSHYFKLTLASYLRNEDNENTQQVLESSSIIYYTQNFKYRYSMKKEKELMFLINNRITPPTYKQLHQPLTYVNDYTMQQGNNGLEQAYNIEGVLSFCKNTNYIAISKGVSSKGKDKEKIAYDFKIRFNYRNKEIVQDVIINEDNSIIYTWKNAKESFTSAFDSKVDWNVNKYIRLSGGLSYNYRVFNTITRSENKDWQGNVRLSGTLPVDIKFDIQSTYHSQEQNYNTTTCEYYDMQARLSRFFLRNKLRISLSAQNLLSHNGIKTEYKDDESNIITQKYPESPIVWLKANYLLFSYYKKR
ncbi:TonB-dependent receptor [Saccharicrinis fermentans]|uniref:TonB-dependent receptor n=1 Tax=Saccharicrinis fermentans TaxID=982 RepID=UPI00138AB679|nr:TonB-dependent receptor [Saccharicrinis fermentans]